VWILDADGREYIHPFASAAEMSVMLRRKSQPSRNFYYMAVFNKTGPVWPAPESTAYGCHAPEWNTWPSEFPPQPGPCPSTVSGWPWWSIVGQTAAVETARAARSAPDAALLSYVLAYLNKKNGTTSAVVSTNPVVQAIASAARGIFATAADTRFIDEATNQTGARQLARWAAGEIAPNEMAHPQLIAAALLWMDTWKRGS
jgi:hypothetical protein